MNAYTLLRRVFRVQGRLFSTRTLKAAIDVHPEVRKALDSQQPVVALESALVTHGLPYPLNLKTAQRLENILRQSGCIPATIAVLNGRCKVGLSTGELEQLSDPDRRRTSPLVKVSRRDLGAAVVLQRDGGTTISGTMVLANLAGIKVFSTGGAGGVHRGGENSMDISADLQELARTPVAVVSAGVKSILDIGRTLEYLETLGVPVLTYKTDYFPAFFCGPSSFKNPWRVDDPETVANILVNHENMGLTSGILLAVPMPEDSAADADEIRVAVDQASAEAELNGMSKSGNNVTPWLLKRVEEITAGKSLQCNIALLENCAEVAGRLAQHYAQHTKVLADTAQHATRTEYRPEYAQSTNVYATTGDVDPDLIVIGASVVDITAVPAVTTDSIQGKSRTTLPGSLRFSAGGVGRNIAEAAHRSLSAQNSRTDSKASTLFISAIGDDPLSRIVVDKQRKLGMSDMGFVRVTGARTDCVNMVLSESGDLLEGIADTGLIQSISGDEILHVLRQCRPKLVVLDGNLSPTALAAIIRHCNEIGIPTFFEPTSVPKSIRILEAVSASIDIYTPSKSPITFISPNILELNEVCNNCFTAQSGLGYHPASIQVMMNFGSPSDWQTSIAQLTTVPASPSDVSKGTLSSILEKNVVQMAIRLLPIFQHIFITSGELGVMGVMRIPSSIAQQWQVGDFGTRSVVVPTQDDKEAIVVQHFPPISIQRESVKNVTGAGDSLVGSLCASLALNPDLCTQPQLLADAMLLAQRTAVSSLLTEEAVGILPHGAYQVPPSSPRSSE